MTANQSHGVSQVDDKVATRTILKLLEPINKLNLSENINGSVYPCNKINSANYLLKNYIQNTETVLLVLLAEPISPVKCARSFKYHFHSSDDTNQRIQRI